ncbi:MAG: hypothetical protein Q8J76_07065, partial [Desulfobulbaceae bacterium]|nr:hypothetical protein [Desulfobulbaceae bacterium]
MNIRASFQHLILAGILFLLAPIICQAEGLIIDKSFGGESEIIVTFASPVDKSFIEDTSNYRVYEEKDPDIRLELTSVLLDTDNKTATLTFKQPLNTTLPHIITLSSPTQPGIG